MSRLLCWLGLHKWEWWGPYRMIRGSCLRCGEGAMKVTDRDREAAHTAWVHIVDGTPDAKGVIAEAIAAARAEARRETLEEAARECDMMAAAKGHVTNGRTCQYAARIRALAEGATT